MVEFVSRLPLDAERGVSFLDFMDVFMSVFEKNMKKDRVSNSILNTLDVLIAGGVFETVGFEDRIVSLINKLFELIRKELFKSKDAKKLISGIKVYVFKFLIFRSCGLCNVLMSNGEYVSGKKVLMFCINYLVHPFPKVSMMDWVDVTDPEKCGGRVVFDHYD
jgi:hypothetical protein